MAEVFITCAITGAGDTVGKSDKVPFTPEAIANDVIAAAQAGACATAGPGRRTRSPAAIDELGCDTWPLPALQYTPAPGTPELHLQHG